MNPAFILIVFIAAFLLWLHHSDLQDVNFCSNSGQKIKTMATISGE